MTKLNRIAGVISHCFIEYKNIGSSVMTELNRIAEVISPAIVCGLTNLIVCAHIRQSYTGFYVLVYAG